MAIYRAFSRATGKIKRSSNGKRIAFGIWAIACILLFDKLQASVGSVSEIGRGFGQVANNMLLTEKVSPFVPHRPFDPNHPKLVLLLAYQRVGSSFTGQMFNQNPDFFYLFEPVDGIYSAMYGAAGGYSVPSDIAYFWNGTVRKLPKMEMESVGEVLGSLLTCDFDSVPTEVLIHRFFGLFKAHHNSVGEYINCFHKNKISPASCRSYIETICPKRFGEDMNDEEYCMDVLWKQKRARVKDVKAFAAYKGCMRDLRYKLEACIPLIRSPCKTLNVRATKTVRLNMETAEYMFKQFTNFRVVHLIRDPRAVALSRIKGDPTYRAKNSKGSISREAGLYCNEVLQDIYVRHRIEEKFPGSVMQIIYEHIVTNPIEQIQGVYSFLNETMPDNVYKWLSDNTDGAIKNSTKIAEKWQEKMTYKMAKEVSDECAELYNAVNYRWPS